MNPLLGLMGRGSPIQFERMTACASNRVEALVCGNTIKIQPVLNGVAEITSANAQGWFIGSGSICSEKVSDRVAARLRVEPTIR
jgi:hypothetical protein